MNDWKWYGHAGHFICAQWCRFHLCTLIGDYLISTVGEYVPDEAVREITASSRKVELKGRGDARLADYMNKIGFEDIGYGRKYETMVFAINGKFCISEECGCGLPEIIPTELEVNAYNDAGAATKGHYVMCERWSQGKPQEAIGG